MVISAAHAFQRHCFQKLDGLASLAGGDEDLGQIAIERLVVGPGVDGLAIVRFGLGQIVLRKGCQAEVPPGNAQLGIERGRLLPRRPASSIRPRLASRQPSCRRLGIVGFSAVASRKISNSSGRDANTRPCASGPLAAGVRRSRLLAALWGIPRQVIPRHKALFRRRRARRRPAQSLPPRGTTRIPQR